ncbi:MAG: ABC-type transport auxiliary lipoprotein family protein [Gallionellaceae bacterium]|jgi:cholesterol transport system auxiliary component
MNAFQLKFFNVMAVSLSFFMVLLLGGCSPLQPVKSASLRSYALEAQFAAAATASGNLTLLVNTPGARSGFDSARMIYLKKPHEIDYFSENQWVDNPARMLAPLLVQALESTAQYRAVVTTRSAVTADLRLDTELVRLQQEFLAFPSQVRLTLRVQLIDMRNKAVLATREFDVTEPATSDDPYGGVLAANRAVKTALQQIADFCVQESKAAEQRGGKK